MANKPLHSSGNKPIHSTNNRPVYSDFVQWSWLMIQVSWEQVSGSAFETSSKEMFVMAYGETIGGTWEYPTAAAGTEAGVLTEFVATETGFALTKRVWVPLNWETPRGANSWNPASSRWEVDVYVWARDNFTPVDHGIRITASVMNAAKTVSADSVVKNTTENHVYPPSAWEDPFGGSIKATVSWTLGTQTLLIT